MGSSHEDLAGRCRRCTNILCCTGITKSAQIRAVAKRWGGHLPAPANLAMPERTSPYHDPSHHDEPRLEALMSTNVHLNAAQTTNFRQKVLQSLAMPIPYQFLPLQDCVDLAIFLIKTTATIQRWTTGVRGVGGAIDVATITRTDGFRAIQEKQILGDRSEL
jgi:hypothetical protein